MTKCLPQEGHLYLPLTWLSPCSAWLTGSSSTLEPQEPPPAVPDASPLELRGSGGPAADSLEGRPSTSSTAGPAGNYAAAGRPYALAPRFTIGGELESVVVALAYVVVMPGPLTAADA